MDTLKERLIRRLEDLSPEELHAVHLLIETFKQPAPPRQPDPTAARRVRSALAHLPGTLTDVIREEREERL